MKKIIFIAVIVFISVCGIIFLWPSENAVKPQNPIVKRSAYNITAEIVEIYDYGILVYDEDARDIIASIDEITEIPEKLHVGDIVEIGYDGTIEETDPARISALSITKKTG